MIAVPLRYEGVDAEYVALTSLIAIQLMFTAISRWCPMYGFLRVQSIEHQYRKEQFYASNVGWTDSAFRNLPGSALIGATMVFTSIADHWLALPALLSISIVTSVILQLDPLYALFELSTRRNKDFRTAGEVITINFKGDSDGSNGNGGHPNLAGGGKNNRQAA